mmetsp:Transcript_62111/g.134845  ORF Transcript_62111/g.134845 Transcript_62111/m.134845 type:complete len:254 (+) Transcript_62111:815-1576(+)
MAGALFVSSDLDSIEKNLLPRKVTPSRLFGLSKISLGSALLIALSTTSWDSSPEKSRAWPPTLCSRGPSTEAASCRRVAPSGTLSPGRQITPSGTSRRSFSWVAAAAEMSPSTTTTSTLFQSFWTSPSFLRRRPKRSHRPCRSSDSSSEGVARARTEPSIFSGTSMGKLQSRLENWPSRRVPRSSKGSTPLPSAISATRLRAAQGLTSNSGSSVNETRIVSPMPSKSKAPIPTADLMRPSAPPPASVTPRCKG